MSGELSVGAISVLAAIGIVGAASLLYTIRRLRRKTRLVVSTLTLLVAVLVYLLLAMLTGNPLFIGIEIVGLVLFLLLIWLGSRYSFWFIAMGWLLHVLWDVGLHPAHTAPYVPLWYAWFCVGFDIVMAFYLAFILAGDQRQ